MSVNHNVSSVKGMVDGLISGTLTGWLFDPTFPDQIQNFFIEVDGRVHTQASAHCYRQDLEEHGFGNGQHGFFINLNLSYEQLAGKLIRLLDRYYQPIENTDYRVVELDNNITCKWLGRQGEYFEYAISCTSPLSETPLSLRYGNASIALMSVNFPAGESTLRVIVPLGILDGFNDVFSLDLAGYPAPIWVATKITDDIAIKQTSFDLIQTSRHAGLDLQLKHIRDSFKLESIITAYRLLIDNDESNTLSYQHDNKVDVTIFLWLSKEFDFDKLIQTIASFIVAYNRCSFELVCVVDEKTRTRLTELLKDHKVSHQVLLIDAIATYTELFYELKNIAKGKYSVVVNQPISPVLLWLDELILPFESDHHLPDITTAKPISSKGEVLTAAKFIDINGQYWDTKQRVNVNHPTVSYDKTDTRSDLNVWCFRSSLFDGNQHSEETPFVFSSLAVASFSSVRKTGLNIIYASQSEIIKLTDVACSPSTVSKQQETKKKSILLIDHAVPSINEDAGSYAAIQEIKLIQSLGFDVLFVDLRLQYNKEKTCYLQRLGVQVLYAPFYSTIESVINAFGPGLSAFYITRYNVAKKVLPIIKRVNAKIPVLFNNADLHFLRELRSALNENSAEKLHHAIVTRDNELAVMKQVDAILSYTETEHAVITSHLLSSEKIHLCPWVLENKQSGLSFAERSGIAFLGGYLHSPNVEAVTFFVECVAPLLLQKAPDINFYIYGSNIPESFQGFSSPNIIPVGFVENLDALYNHHRIFVAPLLSGAGIKGKVLEALAYGLPTVLSSVASEGIGLSHNITTLKANTAEQWCDEIIRLYNDKNLWERISENQKILAQTQFSFSEGKKKMTSIFESVGLDIDLN